MIIKCPRCNSKFDIAEESIDFEKNLHLRCRQCDYDIPVFDPNKWIEIDCPACQSVYNVPKNSISKRSMFVRCSKCDHRFHRTFDFIDEKQFIDPGQIDFEETNLNSDSNSEAEALAPQEASDISETPNPFQESDDTIPSEKHNNDSRKTPSAKVYEDLQFDVDSTDGEKQGISDSDLSSEFGNMLDHSETKLEENSDPTQFNSKFTELIQENEEDLDKRAEIAEENRRAGSFLANDIPSLDNFDMSEEDEFDIHETLLAELEEESILQENEFSPISLKKDSESIDELSKNKTKKRSSKISDQSESPEEEYLRLTSLEMNKKPQQDGRIEREKKEILFLSPSQKNNSSTGLKTDSSDLPEFNPELLPDPEPEFDFEIGKDFQNLTKKDSDFTDSEAPLLTSDFYTDIQTSKSVGSSAKKITFVLAVLIFITILFGIFYGLFGIFYGLY